MTVIHQIFDANSKSAQATFKQLLVAEERINWFLDIWLIKYQDYYPFIDDFAFAVVQKSSKDSIKLLRDFLTPDYPKSLSSLELTDTNIKQRFALRQLSALHDACRSNMIRIDNLLINSRSSNNTQQTLLLSQLLNANIMRVNLLVSSTKKILDYEIEEQSLQNHLNTKQSSQDINFTKIGNLNQ